MKTYPEIPGPSKAPHEQCIAFDKLDGSNLRFEYSKKRGWYKFGTRKRLFDINDPEYGIAIPIFHQTFGDEIEKVIKSEYCGVESVIVFCEFFGPNSFCGWHDPNDPKELVLIDINLHKKGLVPPRDFVNNFGHVKAAKVVYEGNFNKQFIEDVKNNQYSVYEGVVAKGILNPSNIHTLWMSKVKTKKWLADLQEKASESEEFRKFLSDNQREQA